MIWKCQQHPKRKLNARICKERDRKQTRKHGISVPASWMLCVVLLPSFWKGYCKESVTGRLFLKRRLDNACQESYRLGKWQGNRHHGVIFPSVFQHRAIIYITIAGTFLSPLSNWFCLPFTACKYALICSHAKSSKCQSYCILLCFCSLASGFPLKIYFLFGVCNPSVQFCSAA